MKSLTRLLGTGSSIITAPLTDEAATLEFISALREFAGLDEATTGSLKLSKEHLSVISDWLTGDSEDWIPNLLEVPGLPVDADGYVTLTFAQLAIIAELLPPSIVDQGTDSYSLVLRLRKETTGAVAPTVKALRNPLDLNITCSYSTVGRYLIEGPAGSFPIGRTKVSVPEDLWLARRIVFSYLHIDETAIEIQVYAQFLDLSDTALTNDWLDTGVGHILKIETYPAL